MNDQDISNAIKSFLSSWARNPGETGATVTMCQSRPRRVVKAIFTGADRVDGWDAEVEVNGRVVCRRKVASEMEVHKVVHAAESWWNMKDHELEEAEARLHAGSELPACK
jgi:hypothetical protein